MKTLKNLLAVVGFAAFLTACENDKSLEDLPVVKDDVSFALDIQPIISAHCAGCHNPANVNPDLRKDFAYASLTEDEESIVPGNSEDSELVQMLERVSEDGKAMPPSETLSPFKLALIRKWIDEGAKNN
ncbi:MAG: hypothetical protein OJF59_001797 [Cytophagales bacterium]|jgi:mono/diheme cytochrome c family protein|nr:MAG: hypothetical protein OJF59_001797 [Cytophagales bacterium]